MKFRNRLIRTEEGGIEIRLTFVFRPDEVASLSKVPSDPNVSFENLREGGPDLGSKVDWYLQWLRILCQWVGIWNDRDNMKGYVVESVNHRKAILARPKRKKRK